MTRKTPPSMPLAGGEYVQNDAGLKRVAKPTALPAGKSTPREPDKPRATPSRPAAAKTE